MVSVLGSIPSCCIACLPKSLKTQTREKKNSNHTDFWKDVVQVSDDATKKMLLKIFSQEIARLQLHMAQTYWGAFCSMFVFCHLFLFYLNIESQTL